MISQIERRGKPIDNPAQRFVETMPVVVDTRTGCWLWTRAISFSDGGYAKWCFRGRDENRNAHRVVWELYNGRRSSHLNADHLCRNKRCVNPSHVEMVSIATNVLRGESPFACYARRTHCNHGHRFSGSNLGHTWRKNRGRLVRYCKPCKRAWDKAKYWAVKVESKP